MAKKPKKDDAAPAAGAEGEKPKGLVGKLLGNKKLLIIVVAAVVLIAGGGGAAVFLMGGGDDEALAEAPKVPAEPTAFYYDLPVMIVNLTSAENRETYVKVAVALEVADQEMLKVIEPNMPRVLDAFQTYMRELRASDLQGSAGLYRLKEELQRRVNVAVYPARVDDVLFKNIIIQ
ncbi:flagellar basal body-associated FliL family protein [Chthonobacter rhizosphaerae]|uniref:flagellar basal body-associated FliL family protein n=1 Tax=Chthonobacter rhizosphaerae TaxID=2735553 RepID=UPI0015EF5A86|nr:flagellar basal body-associated FliL family protein [Chthonobacter rhizosphaerae]